jgi:regulator of RNase E activity RraB
MGYRVDSESENSGSENPFGLCFGKNQKVSPEAIDETVIELNRMSKHFRGEYDGWEAEVVPRDHFG